MRQTTLFYVAAGLFFLTAVVNFLGADTAQGAVFTALGAAFIAIGSSYRKRSSATATPIQLSEVQQREVQTLVDSGNKVGATKHVRQETGAGLKEAKLYVDRIDPRITR